MVVTRRSRCKALPVSVLMAAVISFVEHARLKRKRVSNASSFGLRPFVTDARGPGPIASEGEIGSAARLRTYFRGSLWSSRMTTPPTPVVVGARGGWSLSVPSVRNSARGPAYACRGAGGQVPVVTPPRPSVAMRRSWGILGRLGMPADRRSDRSRRASGACRRWAARPAGRGRPGRRRGPAPPARRRATLASRGGQTGAPGSPSGHGTEVVDGPVRPTPRSPPRHPATSGPSLPRAVGGRRS